MVATAEERQRGASSTPLSARGASSTPLTARGPGVVPRLFLSPDRPSTSSAAQRSVDLDSGFWQDGFSVEDSEVERCQTAAAWHESDLEPEIRAARDQEVRAGVVVSQLTKRGFADHFRSFGLKNYFDEFGQRRFENLSMTVAASTLPNVRSSFGSQADYTLRAQDKQKFSARAYRMSTAVVERDRLLHSQANAMQYRKLTDEDKNNRAHVKRRQMRLMYAIGNPLDEQDIDLPSFLPACCGQQPFDDAPLDCGLRRRERDDRKQNEKLNMLFSDSNPHNIALVKNQGWLLSFSDIQTVLAKVAGWMSAAGLLPNSGIDRSTFCQMMVELDMIDQERVPYVWALQVFDIKAKPMKLCAADPDYVDQTQEGKVATVSFISEWDFIAVMNVLIHQRFLESQRDEFMSRFRHVFDFLEKGWKQKEFEAKEAARCAQLRLEAERDQKKRSMMREISGQESTASNSNGRGSATPSSSLGSAFSIPESQTWKHDRNISGMLKEPEVMQMLEQFRFLFRAIFDSYATDEQEGRKSMSCEDVLTFCYDFKFVPRLASRHEVKRLYSLAVCVEELTIKHPPQAREDGEEVQTPQRSDSVQSNRNSETSSRSRHDKKTSESFNRTIRRASFTALVAKVTQGKGRGMLPDVRAPKSPSPVPKSPSLKGSRMKAVAQAVVAAGADKEEPEDPAPVIVQIFGMPALAETMLRLVFGYFLTFGNYVQLAMTNRAKICWLLAFIRANLVQLRGEGGGQQRQTAVGAFEGSRKGGLAKLLGCLTPEAFDEQEVFTLQVEERTEDAPQASKSGTACESDDVVGNARDAWSGMKSKTTPALSTPAKPLAPLVTPRVTGQPQGITKLVPPEFKKDSFTFSDLLCGKLLKCSVQIQGLMVGGALDKKAMRKRLKKAATRRE
eukprot:TRINITY_DN17046_c0_g3_i1.p1 TRINITY_DN17046_c0_g3~~TRINITY_DN17046_c0_g3_i1.p1  ORF type:complete len:901 (+),score=177.16 TRINITY_DN17046_c0_g3_i1:88-2790(+)